MTNIKSQEGSIIVQVIVFGTIILYFLVSMVSWASLNVRAGQQAVFREQAIQIAESGIDYYRWHLAHAPADYEDGTATSGPYIHNFLDKNDNTVGQFTLTITPPSVGSTLVIVESAGKTLRNENIERKIVIRLAKPSIAKYAVAADAAMRFGAGTEVFGPIHSSGGIRFDGLAHNVISSAMADYNDPDHGEGNEFGVHTHLDPVDPLPPAAVPTRVDVFEAGRQFPVPAIDFDGITADLSQMRTDAQADGFYRPSSGALGYHITLNIDDTFDLYQVTNFINPPQKCNDSGQSGWSTWSVQNETFLGNFSLPSNGIIFLEDHIFVDGQIDTARLNIVAAFFPDNPATRKSITINNDLLYTNYDGSDVIGLIAQNNINAGLVSEDDLRIDAALIAQNGRVGRYYYAPPTKKSNKCSPWHSRQVITLYGMIATNLRYGFAYTDNTGYAIRNLIYDANLLYEPPPSFPLTSEQYTTLSWEEVR